MRASGAKRYRLKADISYLPSVPLIFDPLMLQRLLGFLWRRTPYVARRWRVHMAEAHFAVSVGAVVFNEMEQVLLLKHVFRDGSGWGVPGGYLNHNEQPEEGLRRELREEVNLEVTDAQLRLARTHRRQRHIEMLYVCRADGEAQPRGLEIIEAGWFAPDELPAELNRDQRWLISHALESRDNAGHELNTG